MTPEDSSFSVRNPFKEEHDKLQFERVPTERSDIIKITDPDSKRSSYIEVAPGRPGWGNS